MNPHPLSRKHSEAIDFYSFKNAGLPLVPLGGETPVARHATDYAPQTQSEHICICPLSHWWERVRERVLFPARAPSPAPAGLPLPPVGEGTNSGAFGLCFLGINQ
jgi:hypothetical protein